MQALILAAGVGRRMRPLTDHCHKSLLPIAGDTIINRIMQGLAARSVSPITIVTGYRADELKAHLTRRFPDLRIRFVHNGEYASTNNIYSMELAFQEMSFDDDVILIESDLIYDDRVLDRLLTSPHNNIALVDRYRPGMDGTVVTLGDSGLITQVIPPHLQSSDFTFVDKYKTLNIYRFDATFCRDVLQRLVTHYTVTWGRNSYYELVLGILIYLQQAEIHGEVVQERWAEVDDPNDLRIAEYEFNPTRRYELVTSAWGGNWTNGVLDYAFIRNSYFPTPAMLAELRLNLPDLLANYGSHQAVLNEKLAWALGYPTHLVHALAGASQAFPWLRSWFRDHRILVPTPTFGEYERVFPDAKHYRDHPGFEWDEVERSGAEADLVVFVNPNNPTGSVLPTNRIASYARLHPDKMIVVDESFIDFAEEASIVDLLVEDGLTNVLVIKSLSKSLGVPGLRLGALVTANEDIAERIRDETPIWNLNSVAENFLEVMLKHRPALAQSYRRTGADREQLARSLKECPLIDTVFPSAADFLLVRLTIDAVGAETLTRWLLEQQSVLVKDASGKMSDGAGWWRLAVRGPEDDRVLLSAIDRVCRLLPLAAGSRPVILSGGSDVASDDG